MDIQRIAAFTLDGQGGNPAGVVLADHLPTAADMQAAAARVGYSETVFAARDGDTWTTRYYSPESEVPFCGHATIALGAALAKARGPGLYRLSLANGEVSVEASLDGDIGRATLESLPTTNSAVDDEILREALDLFGLSQDDLDPAIPVALVNAGATHLLLPLRSRDLLARMDYDFGRGRDFMRQFGLVTILLVFRERADLFHARNAFASGGVFEDPATGAAAAALGGFLRDRGLADGGRLTILQGVDMGSPSRIEVDSGGEAGSPVRVSGATAPIT